LRELGYVDGKTIVIEERYADGILERLPQLVAELLRLKVDVIVTTGPTTTRPAKEATSTIPLVMGFDSEDRQDPRPHDPAGAPTPRRSGHRVTCPACG
jgi:hypothetical protein